MNFFNLQFFHHNGIISLVYLVLFVIVTDKWKESIGAKMKKNYLPI